MPDNRAMNTLIQLSLTKTPCWQKFCNEYAYTTLQHSIATGTGSHCAWQWRWSRNLFCEWVLSPQAYKKWIASSRNATLTLYVLYKPALGQTFEVSPSRMNPCFWEHWGSYRIKKVISVWKDTLFWWILPAFLVHFVRSSLFINVTYVHTCIPSLGMLTYRHGIHGSTDGSEQEGWEEGEMVVHKVLSSQC